MIQSRLLSLLLLIAAMLASLVACGQAEITQGDLPLADDQPTFLFFYTDN